MILERPYCRSRAGRRPDRTCPQQPSKKLRPEPRLNLRLANFGEPWGSELRFQSMAHRFRDRRKSHEGELSLLSPHGLEYFVDFIEQNDTIPDQIDETRLRDS